MNMMVKLISRMECAPYILGIHYAKRWPSITLSFGLFDGSELIGVVTYGTPPSATLRSGLCGPNYKGSVIELNRLCLKRNGRNEASFLVSGSLKQIKGDKVVISYADKAEGHVGVVYQAANFIYLGLSAKRTDWAVKGKEHLHGQTIADEFRGVENRSQAMRLKYGDDFYLKPRSRKHRYVYFLGSRKFKKIAKSNLRYTVECYPKKAINA